jgi:hypothetical protein
VLDAGEYDLVEFTNRNYGYRIMYPSVFSHDDVWAYITFYFLGEPVIDVYVDNWEGKTYDEMLTRARDMSLKEIESTNYTIIGETSGTISGGLPYRDFKIDDRSGGLWIKRVRVFAIPDATVRLQYYCPEAKAEQYDRVFEIIAETFDYNPSWISHSSRGADVPLDELYRSGDFDWFDYRNGEYNYRIGIPDFLDIEIRDGFTFFNYGFKAVITIIAQEFPGLDAGGSIDAAEADTLEEFGASLGAKRYGDAKGVTSDGWPWVEFQLDDDNPQSGYTRRVRIIGSPGIAFSIEMYEPTSEIDELSDLFSEVADSFSYEINLLTG